MAFELILPDIGEGVVEAEIVRWLVAPGDEVQEDQPLVEVMTDKATVTIPSPRAGRVVRLHFAQGEVARVHQPLVELDVEGGSPFDSAALRSGRTEDAVADAPRTRDEAVADARRTRDEASADAPPARGEVSADVPRAREEVRPPGTATPAHRKALATPAVRAMARSLGVDLHAVRGTGPGGRVTKDDLQQARNGRGLPPAEHLPGGPEQREARSLSPSGERAGRGGGLTSTDEIIPLRGIRRRIAERMAQSKRTAAHFTFVEQVDVTELTRVKQRVAAAAQADGVKVTFLPFIVKAAVAALKRHPTLNAVLDEAREEIRLRREYHIGIASSTEQGLVVPVVRDADRLSLLEVAREIERLSAASKSGTARPADMGGSTFTITSLGARGGLFATPIINYPEVAILGVHRIRPTPVVRDGQIVARDVMHVSLSFDHRVVDGDVAAAFAYALIAYLEDPALLFMQMV